MHVITATETQGRFGNGQGVEFAEAYLLEYWRPRLGKWVRYRDIKGEEVSTVLQSKVDAWPLLQEDFHNQRSDTITARGFTSLLSSFQVTRIVMWLILTSVKSVAFYIIILKGAKNITYF